MSLQGGPALRSRLKALRVAFKPIGRTWADGAVDVMRPQVPHRTGRLRKSLRVKSATQRKAVVGGHFTAFFVDAGPKRHAIVSKHAGGLIFKGRSGRTIFAKRVSHPGYRGRPFRARAAHEALRRNPMAQGLIKQWNSAA